MSKTSTVTPFPYIVGSPRSGTTLMRVTLNSHPDIAILPETQLNISRLHSNRNNTDFASEMKQMIFGMSNWERFGLKKDLLELDFDAIEPFSVSEGLRIFHRSYAKIFRKKIYGNKTPRHCLLIEEIEELLPEAYFIHIIRDGRAVASSLRDLPFSPGREMDIQAREWVNKVKTAQEQGSRVKKYLEIRYEDLVLNMEETLVRICNFLEVEFNPAMLLYHSDDSQRLNIDVRQHYDFKGIRKTDQWNNLPQLTKKEPIAVRINAWQNELTKDEISQFESVAGPMLEDLGYQL